MVPLDKVRFGNVTKLRKLRVLLLFDRYKWWPGTAIRHLDALSIASHHRVFALPQRGDLPDELDLTRFDAIVIHYSVFMFDAAYLSSAARQRLAEFRGTKAAFVQDEHRNVDLTIDVVQQMGIDILFTVVPATEVDKVYPPSRMPALCKVPVLTGYVDDDLIHRKVPDWTSRPVDVGYRARKLPPWLGTLGREKWIIGERFNREAEQYGLRCDISMREQDRLHGDFWVDFVANCKAVLGTVSGASVFDFSGDIARCVERHLLRAPDTPFDALRELYFANVDGVIDAGVISPRCFEAAALRTLMILYEGNYSDVLEPGRHYVPLKKDHSNMDEVIGVLRSPERALEIIQNAYNEVASNPAYSHAALTEVYDQTLSATCADRSVTNIEYYSEREFDGIRRRNRGGILRAQSVDYVRYYAGKVLFSPLFGLLGEKLRDRLIDQTRRIYRFLAGRY